MVTGVTGRALNVLLRTERASEQEEERELRWSEGVAMESATEREGGRRSYAEGVETERGKREKELKAFESLRCICVHFNWNLFLSQLLTWQKFKCNSSLRVTSSR